jgi:hypothetical protein
VETSRKISENSVFNELTMLQSSILKQFLLPAHNKIGKQPDKWNQNNDKQPEYLVVAGELVRYDIDQRPYPEGKGEDKKEKKD